MYSMVLVYIIEHGHLFSNGYEIMMNILINTFIKVIPDEQFSYNFIPNTGDIHATNFLLKKLDTQLLYIVYSIRIRT